MKAKEFISEGVIRGKQWNEPRQSILTKSLPKDLKPFPGYPGFVYRMDKSPMMGMKTGNFITLQVFDSKNKALAAEIYLQPANIVPGAIETSRLLVYKEYLRQGIAANIYRFLAEDLGKIIIADQEEGHSPDARKLWAALGEERIPSIVVKGWVEISITSPYFSEEDEDTIVDAIMKIGGQFLYSDDEKWIVVFDVLPNDSGTELRAAIQNMLTRNLYHGEYAMTEFDSGLMVISRDKFQQITGYQP